MTTKQLEHVNVVFPESELSHRIPCEFFLLRYVPDVVREEFVNIGVILRQVPTAESAGTEVCVRFAPDWERVLRLDSDVDTALLNGLNNDLTRLVAESSVRQGTTSFESFLAVMQDSFSSSLQLSGPRVSLAESMTAELDRLLRMYVDS